MTDVQKQVQENIDQLIESGAERGVQVAVYLNGELVVDAVAGVADTPIVELWPEFGAHGKHTVTVGHVLTHSAGVPGIPLTTTPEDLCDWDKMCTAIADAPLWWEPGTKVGYHAYTSGNAVPDSPAGQP
jgi:CubicO group peptidase (beta-lactamase class C family)